MGTVLDQGAPSAAGAHEQGVVAAAKAYNAKRRDGMKAAKKSPETKWCTQFGALIYCAVKGKFNSENTGIICSIGSRKHYLSHITLTR